MQDTFSLQEVIEKIAPWIIIIVVPFLFWKIPVWKTRIEEKIENIEEKIEKLESRYENIFQILVGAVGQPLVKSNSPLTLTDYGITISEKINAGGVAKVYAERLFPEIKNLNAYQIQEYCFEYCKNSLLDDLKLANPGQYETIHTVAFEDGIEINKITRVIAIQLRDAIFSMSGTLHEDLDKHSS